MSFKYSERGEIYWTCPLNETWSTFFKVQKDPLGTMKKDPLGTMKKDPLGTMKYTEKSEG